MIHKINPSEYYNKCLKRLDTSLNETKNLNLIKGPKVVKQQIRISYYKTLGTSVINSQMSPPSLILFSHCYTDLLLPAEIVYTTIRVPLEQCY